MIWYNERFYPGGQLGTYLESCGLGMYFLNITKRTDTRTYTYGSSVADTGYGAIYPLDSDPG
jgi:hypothetical protein